MSELENELNKIGILYHLDDYKSKYIIKSPYDQIYTKIDLQIKTIYKYLGNIDISSTSNVVSVIDSMNTIKTMISWIGGMMAEVKMLKEDAKTDFTESLKIFQNGSEILSLKQYNYKDRRDTFCSDQSLLEDKVKHLDQRIDDLKDDVKSVSMMLNVLLSYWKEEVKNIVQ